jgi:hypothetical protein
VGDPTKAISFVCAADRDHDDNQPPAPKYLDDGDNYPIVPIENRDGHDQPLTAGSLGRKPEFPLLALPRCRRRYQPKPVFAVVGLRDWLRGNGRLGARLWENTWDEAADAVFAGKTLGMPDRSTDACGLNEAIRS